jgi:hypothetical protein
VRRTGGICPTSVDHKQDKLAVRAIPRKRASIAPVRVRVWALVCTIGSVGLALSMLAPWYTGTGGELVGRVKAAHEAFVYYEHLWLLGIAGASFVLGAIWLVQGKPRVLLPALCLLLGVGAVALVTYRLLEPPGFAVEIELNAGGYIALAGASLIAVGGLLGAVLEPVVVALPRYKRCPDCASRMRAEARVCLRCGYRGPPGKSEVP